SGFEIDLRLIDWFAGQLKSAEVHANALPGFKILMCLDSFLRVHVHGFHEPARCVSSNPQKRQVGWPEPLPDFREVAGVARVTAKVDEAVAVVKHVAAPETLLPIPQTASGE